MYQSQEKWNLDHYISHSVHTGPQHVQQSDTCSLLGIVSECMPLEAAKHLLHQPKGQRNNTELE